MLEVIQMILDAIVNVGPRALAARRSKKKAELGASIFSVAIRAQHIADRGDRILHLLSLAREVAQLPPSSEPRGIESVYLDPAFASQRRWRDRILFEIEDQIRELATLAIELGHYAECVSLIAPDSIRQINHNTWRKLIRLQFYRQISASEDSREASELCIPLVDSTAVAQMDALSPDTYARIPWSYWRIGIPLDEASIVDIETYLSRAELQTQLDGIRSALDQLRVALEEHFTISEIMLELSPSAIELRRYKREQRNR